MKTIPIRYRYGRYDWQGNLWSASAVQQVLDFLRPELQKRFGSYSWWLEEDINKRGKRPFKFYYQIVARSGDTKWIEGTGRTPQLALKDWCSGWVAIQEYLAT